MQDIAKGPVDKAFSVRKKGQYWREREGKVKKENEKERENSR